MANVPAGGRPSLTDHEILSIGGVVESWVMFGIIGPGSLEMIVLGLTEDILPVLDYPPMPRKVFPSGLSSHLVELCFRREFHPYLPLHFEFELAYVPFMTRDVQAEPCLLLVVSLGGR